MSQEIHLTMEDYNNIRKWYEMAFAKKQNDMAPDQKTIRRIVAMAEAYWEELQEMERIRRDDKNNE